MSGDNRESSLLTPFAIVASVALHLGIALFVWFIGRPSFNRKPPAVEIMDMTVVLHQNLDKEPDELKPDDAPKPPPPPKPLPPPKPKVVEKPPPPKVDAKVDAVEKLVEKPKDKPKEKPKEKPKSEDPEKKPGPEPPKKPRAFTKGRRVEDAPKAKPAKPDFTKGRRVTGGGPRTDRKLSSAEIRRLLAMGAKEGTRNQVPESELSMCLSNIKNKFYDAWDQPAWSAGIKPATLMVVFGPGGRVVSARLTVPSGNNDVDASIRQAAARVRQVPGLTAEFLGTYKEVPVIFEVLPQ